MQLDKKRKFNKNRGWFARMQKGVFFCHSFGCGGFVFLSLCFCAFVLCKIAQNGYFHAFLEVFCLFCSHKRPVLKCFFSSHFGFFLLLSSLSKFHLFICFLSINPVYRRLFVGFLFFSFACLFLRFACLFDTNFPNIPFLKSNLLSFLAVYFFSSVVLVFVFIVYVSAFLFFVFVYVGFVFGFFLFCVVFLSLSSFLFCCQSMKTKLFSMQFWCFFELCWLKG